MSPWHVRSYRSAPQHERRGYNESGIESNNSEARKYFYKRCGNVDADAEEQEACYGCEADRPNREVGTWVDLEYVNYGVKNDVDLPYS